MLFLVFALVVVVVVALVEGDLSLLATLLGEYGDSDATVSEGAPASAPKDMPACASEEAPVPASQYVSIVSDDEWSEGGHKDEGSEAKWKKKVEKGDRPKSLFLTWSNTDKPQLEKPSAFSRKGFARAIEHVCHLLQAKMESVAIFKEEHKDGATHFHALLILAEKSSKMWAFSDRFLSQYKGAVFTEVVVGNTNKPHYRILEYLLSPTPQKPQVDTNPYISKNLSIPDNLWDKAAKAQKKLGSSPATPNEIYSFLLERKEIRSYDDLLEMIDSSGQSKGLTGVTLGRISRYINNNIVAGRANELVSGLIHRRDRIAKQVESLTTPTQYLEKYIEQCEKCVCPTGAKKTTLAEDIDWLVDFHGIRNIGPFFEWADKFFGGELPVKGRPKNCYIIGCPGSGKSTLADLAMGVIPEDRIFSPTLNSSTPFSKLRDHHILSACDDWRFNLKVPVTETLQWMEGRGFGVDVKGKEPVEMKSGPVCLYSANHKKPTANWSEVDIQAFEDRCYVSVMKNKVPPNSRSNVANKMETCFFCRIDALAKYAPSVAKLWGSRHSSSKGVIAPPKKANKHNYDPFDEFDNFHPDFFQ